MDVGDRLHARSAAPLDPARNPLFSPQLIPLVQRIETSGTPQIWDDQTPPSEIDSACAPVLAEISPRGADYAAYYGPAVPLTEIELDHHHGDWIKERTRLAAALRRCGTSAKTVERFEACGSTSYVLIHKQTGDARISASYCHHRLCRPCARRRAAILSSNLLAHLIAKHHLHIVLTLKSTDAPLAHEIDRIYRAFKALRKTQLWRSAIGGGAAFFETTLNEVTARWHPHLHVLAEGRYIDHAALSAAWHAATGDSTIVGIFRVADKTKAIAETAKYVSKSLSPALYADPEALDEFICAIRGRRLCLTFGRWHEVKLSDRDPNFARSDWTTICTLDELVIRAEDGEPWALRTLHQLTKSKKSAPRPPPLPAPRLFPRQTAA